MSTLTRNSLSAALLDVRMLRSLLQMPRDSRERLLRALTDERIDEQSLLDLIAVAENPNSTPQDREGARDTIQEMLQVYGHTRELGASRSRIESRDVGRNQEADRILQDMDSQEKRFAARLRELMKAKGLTQMELANRSDCTQPAISQMLSRECRPQKRTILKLADALGVAPADLWLDLDVADILDTVAAAQDDNEPLSRDEAAAIDRAMHREAGPAGRPLPKFKR